MTDSASWRPSILRDWGDGTYPPLYCPDTPRQDTVLAQEVNNRLLDWCREVGIYADRIEWVRDVGWGHLATATYAGSDDTDMLLLAAQINMAWWACDDYYADETSMGAAPERLAERLALVLPATDPQPPVGDYTRQLDDAVAADPVLVAFRSAFGHLARNATHAQVGRVQATTYQMYVSWNAYGAWRHQGILPPTWRYLAARQHDSFYTSMTLIDIVEGYELPANVFYDPRFHRAMMQAGTASVVVNDLYSVARETADELGDSNLIRVIAHERSCPIREATEAAVVLHNDMVHGFEDSHHELAGAVSPEMDRFLIGLRNWMGGGFYWHATSMRYQ